MMDWQPIETAPKDGTRLLLWCERGPFPPEPKFGSWRVDGGFSGNEEPLWLDESFDDFSCGYASVPLNPTHWLPVMDGPRPC